MVQFVATLLAIGCIGLSLRAYDQANSPRGSDEGRTEQPSTAE